MSEVKYEKFVRRVAKVVGREARKAGLVPGQFAGGVISDEQGEIFSMHVSIEQRKELH